MCLTKQFTMAKPNEFANTLMSELIITAAKAGWEPRHFSDLAKSEEKMKLVLGLIRGTHEIKSVEGMIDCDALPMIPSNWNIKKHQKCGVIKFDISKIELYFLKGYKNVITENNDLLVELKGKKLMNANVLDYLLANPKYIPEEWRKLKRVFFLGTVYGVGDYLGFRYIEWRGGRWCWNIEWPKEIFFSEDPIALFKE